MLLLIVSTTPQQENKMNYKIVVVFVYAALLLIGGIIGYIKADSLPSLIMGVVSALLVAASGFAMLRSLAWGNTSALLLSGLLFLFFSYRFTNSFKFMPAGLMALISLAVLVVLLTKVTHRE